MEVILAALGTQAGQALVTAGISQLVTLLGGGSADQAASDFAAAVGAWQAAAADFKNAEQTAGTSTASS